MSKAATICVSQSAETPTQGMRRGRIAYRYAYARAADSCALDEIGQDYLTICEDGQRLVFALCDGVGQSFFGDFAARMLGDQLRDALWETAADLDKAALDALLVQVLSDLTESASATVAAIALPPNISPLLRSVLEQKRVLGSESNFACGLLNLQEGQIYLAWMGDIRLRLWNSDGEISALLGETFHTAERWSSQRGLIGTLHTYSGSLAGLRRLVAYSDGLSRLDQGLAVSPDAATLDAEIEAADAEPGSDDRAYVEVCLQHVPTRWLANQRQVARKKAQQSGPVDGSMHKAPVQPISDLPEDDAAVKVSMIKIAVQPVTPPSPQLLLTTLHQRPDYTRPRLSSHDAAYGRRSVGRHYLWINIGLISAISVLGLILIFTMLLKRPSPDNPIHPSQWAIVTPSLVPTWFGSDGARSLSTSQALPGRTRAVATITPTKTASALPAPSLEPTASPFLRPYTPNQLPQSPTPSMLEPSSPSESNLPGEIIATIPIPDDVPTFTPEVPTKTVPPLQSPENLPTSTIAPTTGTLPEWSLDSQVTPTQREPTLTPTPTPTAAPYPFPYPNPYRFLTTSEREGITMEYVTVSVSSADLPKTIELDLSAELPAGQLAAQIAKELGLESGTAYAIEIVASGHRLRPDESLAAAQVWDGEQLRLVRLSVVPATALPLALVSHTGAPLPVMPLPSDVPVPPSMPPTAPSAPASEKQPTITWRPLDPPTAPSPTPSPDDNSFTWKPLD